MRKILFRLRLLFKIPFLMLRSVKFGKDFHIEPRVFLSSTSIGDYTYIGHNSVINKATIGNYCSIAAFSQIGGMEHSHWWWSTSPRLSDKGQRRITTIGHDVWIGSKVSLREGITIGNGAVIGANSVVLKDVEPYTIVAGIPAKVLKTRFTEKQMSELEATKYYDKKPADAKVILDNLKISSDK